MVRKLFYIVAGLVVLLLVVAVLLPFVIDANKFKPQIESAAESALGRKVAIGNIRLALLSGGVGVDDIAISEDPKFGPGSFFTAKSVAVGVELMPLIFSKQLHVTGITIDQPEVTLLRAPSGDWNFSSSARMAPAPKAPQVPPRPLRTRPQTFLCKQSRSKTESSPSAKRARTPSGTSTIR